MIGTTLFLAASLGASALPPDELDIVVTPAAKINLLVLVDNSSGMNGNPKPASDCPWFQSTYLGGASSMKAYQQLQAALVGCRSRNDGVLSKYIGQVNFAFAQIDQTYLLRSNWANDVVTHETQVMGLTPASKVYVAQGMREAARSFNTHFNDGNATPCAHNFVIYVGGGNDNGSGIEFDAECSGHRQMVGTAPEAAAYLAGAGTSDMLCSLSGVQNIETWTVGVAPTGSGTTRLQSMALNGRGEYFLGNDYHQIALAFETVLSNIVARANLSFAAATIQTDGLFSQNNLYTVAFSPRRSGPWAGNTKKHCIFPKRLPDGAYDANDLRCVFFWNTTQQALFTNPQTVDLWTGTVGQEAAVGGAGAKLCAPTGNNLGPKNGTPATPHWPRQLFTWRGGTTGYIQVRPDNATFTPADAWVLADERAKLFNRLHGYTYAKTAGGSAPVRVAEWPMGDPIHSNSVLFRYGDDCESAPGKCWLALATNHGVLSFIDAYDGKESAGIIPAEIWRPNDISRHQLSDIMQQPNANWAHHYYFDGGLRRYHVDANGDGVINNGETAFLIVGLGRAGSATYLIPMSRFNGVPTSSDNPIRPIVNTPGTPFEELRETWGGPWLGRAKLAGADRRVAVFGSGHVAELDWGDKMVPSTIRAPLSVTPMGTPLSADCVSFAGGACSYYNLLGYPDPLLDETVGPFQIPDAIAYRLVFATFDLDSNDVFFVQDGLGRRAAALSGSGGPHSSHSNWSSGLNAMTTPWVFSEKVSWRLATNGTQTSNRGYVIARIEYLTASRGMPREHYPTVYVVDVDRWNGSTPRDFAATASGDGVLLQISRSCRGASATRLCLDATEHPALRYMTCPISADVAVYSVDERLSSIYWGDECGQIFTARLIPDGGDGVWKVRRLLTLNDPAQPLDSQLSPVGRSKDFRKIFRRLDLVLTMCPGRRMTGIYFGSGNVQRPSSFDDLQDARLNSGRDVVGVVWDDGDISDLYVERDLADVSGTAEVDPGATLTSGKKGWFWRLGQGERMLRDPIVIEGVAYFKTHHPVSVGTACVAGTGQEQIYAVNSCSARAIADGDGSGAIDTVADRKAWTAAGDIGGDPLLMVPLDDGVFVTHADLNTSQRASVVPQRRGPIFRMLHWRVPKHR